MWTRAVTIRCEVPLGEALLDDPDYTVGVAPGGGALAWYLLLFLTVAVPVVLTLRKR